MGDDKANLLNENINHALNDTGKIYLTHTKVEGSYVLRMVTAQTSLTEHHVMQAWDLIRETASALSAQDGSVDID